MPEFTLTDDGTRNIDLVAEYGVLSPKAVNGWANWTFWQYSSTGKVDGVSTAVDLDYFNGTDQSLSALVSASVPPEI